MAFDERPTFGFSLSGGSSTDTANYTVQFSGSTEIGVAATQAVNVTQGRVWYSSIAPVPGGFVEGVGYVTATITDKTTGTVSQKSWKLTVVPHIGMTQYTRSPAWWNDKSAASGASNETATFGFQITNAVAADFDVTFTGGENIGAASTQTVLFSKDYGAVWYSSIKPVAGGFTNGTGTITATAKHKLTGKVLTRTYQLTIVDHIGMTQYTRSPAWWNDKTVAVGSATGQTFGFQITNAAASDYTVTITGGSEVNGTPSVVNFSSTYGSVWYSTVNAGTGGFKAGTSTITATATHKLTGKVYTKTYQLVVN